MKFHVGDRWADQHGGEWFVYGKTAAGTKVLAFCQERGLATGFDFDEGYGDQCVRGDIPKLKRLISSERWIPFAEMMPEETENSDSYVLLWAPQYPHYETAKIYAVEGIRQNNEAAGRSFTHWRYLTPPEAP